MLRQDRSSDYPIYLSFKWQKQIDITLATGRSLTSQIWKTVSWIIIYTFQPRAEEQTSNVSRIISRVIWKCTLFHLAEWTEVIYSGYYQTIKLSENRWLVKLLLIFQHFCNTCLGKISQITTKCIVYLVLQSLVLHLSRMHNIGTDVAEKNVAGSRRKWKPQNRDNLGASFKLVSQALYLINITISLYVVIQQHELIWS